MKRSVDGVPCGAVRARLARRQWIACLLALGLPWPSARARTVSELSLKASYLYQFGNYVDWPSQVFPDPDSTLRIGVLDSPAMVEQLRRTVQGRTLKGHAVEVFAVEQTSDRWQAVHMLFIGRSDQSRLDRALDHLGAQPALVVTELPGALEQGSVINFVVVDQRVRFEVAPENARRRRLHVSARLLSAAWRVGTRY